ncbi:MAG: HTTM domain-containing protein [Pseudomonadota bacterium]
MAQALDIDRNDGTLAGRVRTLFSIDVRSLAAMRVLLGITVVYCLLMIFPDLRWFYTDQGFLTRAEALSDTPYAKASLLFFNGSYTFAVVLWVLALLAAASFMVGFRARLSALLCWILYMSFVGRNPLVGQGGDALILLLLFWSMFLPVGRAFSIDAALSDNPRPSGKDREVCSVATVGLLLQVLYVYVFGALLKTGPQWMPDGSAVYFALHLDTFATELSMWFRQFFAPTQILTYFVFWLELLAPVLLFFPDKRMLVRTATLALLIAMHLGFRVFIRIGHFWMASLSSLCTYIPGWVWDWIEARYWTDGQRSIEIYYDRDCGFCRKVALILREFFLPISVPIRPAQDFGPIGEVLEREVSWVVIDHTGKQRLHWDAVAYVMCQSWCLLPLGWIAVAVGKIGVGKFLYDRIGANRRPLGRLTAWLTPETGIDARLGGVTRAGLCAVIAVCFIWNFDMMSGQTRVEVLKGSPLERPMAFLGLTQRWGMFAPFPATDEGYIIAETMTENGDHLDVAHRQPVPYVDGAPENLFSHFSNYRWRRYQNRVILFENKERFKQLSRFARAACALHNRGRGEGERIVQMSIRAPMKRQYLDFQQEHIVADFGAWNCVFPNTEAPSTG